MDRKIERKGNRIAHLSHTMHPYIIPSSPIPIPSPYPHPNHSFLFSRKLPVVQFIQILAFGVCRSIISDSNTIKGILPLITLSVSPSSKTSNAYRVTTHSTTHPPTVTVTIGWLLYSPALLFRADVRYKIQIQLTLRHLINHSI